MSELTVGRIANWSVDSAPPGPVVEAQMWLPKRLDFSNGDDARDFRQANVTKLQAWQKIR